MIECALIVPLSVMLLFGVSSIGIRLGRTIQATQLARDVGHMYALGADFSKAGNQNIASLLGTGFNLTSSGDTLLILSRVVRVYQADCNAASLSNCPNLNQAVFAQRLNIGNTQVSQQSLFGTPPATYINSQGNIKPSDYCKYSQLIASGFNSVLTLQQGQSAWMIEGVFPMPDLNFLNSPGTANPGSFYVRFIF